ncbi:MAG: hypothetical protein O7D30_08665, partial [Rickettsia endosymbiont of Ixodes persulcatus]|nr:hypothetical protein [Rickettsia endosymbiont of Ixodes persulcatus]
NNLKKRRELIDEKKYHPERDPEISKWWSTSITDSTNTSRVLFLPAKKTTPNCMKLKDILSELKPMLRLASSEDEKTISVNISQFDKTKQRRIRDIFTRFLEIQYGGYGDIRNIPTADVHAHIGVLTINGITLSELKREIVRSEAPLVEEYSRCRIM